MNRGGKGRGETYGYTLVTDTKFFVLLNVSTSKDHKSVKRYSMKFAIFLTFKNGDIQWPLWMKVLDICLGNR